MSLRSSRLPCVHASALVMVAVWCAIAEPVDSVMIQGRWTQNGQALKRRPMETMLLGTAVAGEDIDNAKGLRAASFALGATMWCASTAVTVVQIVDMVQQLQDPENLLVAKNPTFALDGPLLALSISTDITAFIQGRLTSRAEYRQFRGIRAFNESIAGRTGTPVNRTISDTAAGPGLYRQGGVVLSTGAVLHVLREEPSARFGSIRSAVYAETGARVASVGVTLLVLGILGYVYDDPSEARLGWGIGLTTFSIVNAIAAKVSRTNSIKRYNAALVPKAPLVPDENAGLE